MADDPEDRTPRRQSSESARDIYERLMALPRDSEMSNNEWAKKAGVNTSFFTNVRNGSDPSINNLRSILRIANCSLPEFFLSEANSRVVKMPKREGLELAIEQALTALPKRAERRPQYLAEVLLQYLALPENDLASQTIQDDSEGHGDEEYRATQGATKKVARS